MLIFSRYSLNFAQRYNKKSTYANIWAQKSVRITFARENFLRIGFEACFFLCNPATSSLPGG